MKRMSETKAKQSREEKKSSIWSTSVNANRLSYYRADRARMKTLREIRRSKSRTRKKSISGALQFTPIDCSHMKGR